MSTRTCDDIIRQHVEALGKRFSCYEENGRLWLVSPFAYPDQDLLELAIRQLPGGEFRVTDLGETLRHLASAGFDPRSTPKGEYLLEEILKQHGVTLDRGMIIKHAQPPDLGSTIQDVLAACLAIAHLEYLSRGARPATFHEEVSHFLAELDLEVDTQHYEVGRSGKKYRIHLYVRSTVQAGLIQALSPATPAGATTTVNATFRLWHDVPNHRWRATVLDDRQVQWRPEDVNLLRSVTPVYRWTDRGETLRRELRDALGNGAGQHPHPMP